MRRGSGYVLWLVGLSWPTAGGAEPPAELPEPGAVVERRLDGGEADHYAFSRDSTQELLFALDQQGIDLTVAVLGTDGEVLWAVDSLSGGWGRESLLFRAEASHSYLLEIRCREPTAMPGRYRLWLEPRSGDPPSDPRRLAAERALTEAGRLLFEGTRDSRRQALPHFQEALAAWQELDETAQMASALFHLAMLRRYLGEPREALALHRRALGLWQSLDHLAGQARAWTEIGSVAWALGESEHSPDAFRRALGMWRALGDLDGQARTSTYLGLVWARKDPRRALAPYGEALALYRQTGNLRQEGVLLNNSGGVWDLLGEPAAALEHFEQALEVQRSLGDREQQAVVWNNIASMYRRTGRLQEALEHFDLALEARRELGDRRGQGRVLNNLGITYLRLGDADRARVHLRQALAARRDSQDRRGEAITLHNLGLVHGELGIWEKALEGLAQALALRRATGDRSGEAMTLVELGRAEGKLGRPTSARQSLEEALAILEEAGTPWRRARALATLGQVLTASGQAEQATATLGRALELHRTVGDEIGEGETLLALGRAERSRGPQHLFTAIQQVQAGIDLLDSLRADLDSLGLRTSFLSHHANAFELAIDLAMELHRRELAGDWATRALEISERARARSLLDLLEESGAGLRRGVDAALLERQQELLERLNAKVARHRRSLERQGRSAESERLAAETGDVRAELEAVENEIRRQNPAWDALARPRPLTASAIQALLDPETTLLEYSLGAERSFLWKVTKDRIESFELAERALIEAAAREVYEGLRIHDPRARAAEAEAAARLSEMLLAPVADRLTSGQRLAIVGDGALHYLPFAALPHPAASAEPLLARHEIVALPSASALGVQRQTLAGRPLANKTLAVLADPVFGTPDPRLPAPGAAGTADPGAAPITLAARDPVYRGARSGDLRLDRLLWSRWEAETIAAHAGDRQALVILGFDADLAAVRGGRLAGHRIVHFATHGIVESEHPELSALVLSLYDPQGRPREGFLRLPEIYNLDLDAELVVLSGCRTALGPEIRGEGLVGLTRGFFAAGARHLVASLWRVQDHAAAELMNRFYRHLLADGGQARPAAALRAAQLELLSDPEYRDPYHWAAFAIYGDWRSPKSRDDDFLTRESSFRRRELPMRARRFEAEHR